MFFFAITLLFSVVLGNPNPNPQGSWPWLPQQGQAANSPNWGNSYSPGFEGTGRGFTSDRQGGEETLTWGSLIDTTWGTQRCGGYMKRPRCAPSINTIEQKLLSVGKKIEGFCNAYSDRPLREVYGVDYFKLRVRLSEFTSDDIQIRVRQRLVTVLARTCSSEYAGVRILPDIVDARLGKWRLERKVLTVWFPYTITPDTEIQSRCGREFDPDPIIVPKSADDVEFPRDIVVSFNDASFRRALKRYLEDLATEDDTQYVD